LGNQPRRLGTRRGICPDAGAPAREQTRGIHTEPFNPSRAQSPLRAQAEIRRDAHPREAERPTFGEVVDETIALIDFVGPAGPPVAFVSIAYLVFVPMLFGPILLLVTLAAVALIAVVLVVLAGAIVATPYLLLRRLQGRRAAHTSPLRLHQFRARGTTHA
jgi:hypothetical protein